MDGKCHRLRDLDATAALAQSWAKQLRVGDVLALHGPMGAGKTTFAQYLIRALSRQPVEVVSPTFTLLQTYPIRDVQGHAAEIWHYDLYRIDDPSDLLELGFEECTQHITLIEWPERLVGTGLSITAVLKFSLLPDGGRIVEEIRLY